jgi:hypothetical protein
MSTGAEILEATRLGAMTLRFLLYALLAGMALLVPSLWLLFRVFKSQQPVDRSIGTSP